MCRRSSSGPGKKKRGCVGKVKKKGEQKGASSRVYSRSRRRETTTAHGFEWKAAAPNLTFGRYVGRKSRENGNRTGVLLKTEQCSNEEQRSRRSPVRGRRGGRWTAKGVIDARIEFANEIAISINHGQGRPESFRAIRLQRTKSTCHNKDIEVFTPR